MAAFEIRATDTENGECNGKDDEHDHPLIMAIPPGGSKQERSGILYKVCIP